MNAKKRSNLRNRRKRILSPKQPKIEPLPIMSEPAPTSPSSYIKGPAFLPPTSGIRTTEFWIVMFINLLSVAITVIDQTNAHWSLLASSISGTVYATLRSAIKNSYTQRSSELQKVATKAGVFLIGFFVFGGSLLLSSCSTLPGLAQMPLQVSWERDDFDLTVKRENGQDIYYYTHHDTGRQFRAVQNGDLWEVETKDASGLWFKYGDAKSGLNELPDLNLPEIDPAK